MKLKRGQRNLILAIINVAVLIAAAFIVHSRAADDAAPTSGRSFALSGEPEFELTPYVQTGSSASAAPAPSSPSNPLQDVLPGVAQADTSLAPLEAPEIPPLEPQEISFPPLAADDELRPYADAEIGSNPLAWTAAGATPGAGGSPGRYPRAGASPGGYGGGGGGAPSPRSGPSPGNTAPAAGASALSARASAPHNDAAQAAPLLPELSVTGLPAPLLLPPSSNAPAAIPDWGFTGAGFGQGVTTGAASSHAAIGQRITTLQTPVAVPEPSSLLLIGGSLAAVLYRRRRRTNDRFAPGSNSRPPL